jgi:hypothetical protein
MKTGIPPGLTRLRFAPALCTSSAMLSRTWTASTIAITGEPRRRGPARGGRAQRQRRCRAQAGDLRAFDGRQARRRRDRARNTRRARPHQSGSTSLKPFLAARAHMSADTLRTIIVMLPGAVEMVWGSPSPKSAGRSHRRTARAHPNRTDRHALRAAQRNHRAERRAAHHARTDGAARSGAPQDWCPRIRRVSDFRREAAGKACVSPQRIQRICS